MPQAILNKSVNAFAWQAGSNGLDDYFKIAETLCFAQIAYIMNRHSITVTCHRQGGGERVRAANNHNDQDG